MSNATGWNIPAHPLRWPINDANGAELAELTLRPILHGEHLEVLNEYDDSDDRLDALMRLTTGQPDDVLVHLKTPDYNALAARIGDMVAKDADYFIDGKVDPDAPRLLHPVTLGGVLRESLSLEVPTLAASRKMRQIKDKDQAAAFITAHCTGLQLPDLDLLSVPDWNQLQGRINDFLNEPAASFPKAT
ncbi:MAG: phage tail assembly protein [Pseudomonadota bacterium]|nr:phage tail assembly protein [Pseudomonadota bacterium]